MSHHHATPLQSLEGVIERLTYHNEDNGYTVARFTPKNKSYQVTIIGAMLGINVGESLRLAGQWITHAQYGKQFQVEHVTVQLPATIEGIRKYLGSGLIKGIGPKTSSKIVDFFGLETLTVIEKEPERLLEVPSIGQKRVEKITQTWQEQLHIKEIMLFLQANQVTAFDGQLVEYEFSQLDQLLHSYAVSVHKSQGSEYPVVVMLEPQHVMMLQRNLLYTAPLRQRRLWSWWGRREHWVSLFAMQI